MTKEEAIKYFEKRKEKSLMLMKKAKADTPTNNKFREIVAKKIEVLDMAISALSEELSEDGILTVHVSDGSKAKRVLVLGDNIFGGLYYPDSAENKGDTVSQAAYEQIKWERDIAIQQLKDLGYGLGEKPKEDKEEWIPVSERLPNHDECIKNNRFFNVSDGYRSYSEWFDYDKQMFGEPTMSGFCVDRAVIAWQPLPEPYKKGE